MAMNNFRKDAAVKKYAGKTQEVPALIEMIKQDEKKYTDEEVLEIINAISEQDNNTPAPKPKTLNKIYEEWRVSPDYEVSEDGKSRKHVGFNKEKKLRETSITPDRAEEMNAQSLNSGTRLYEK